METATVDFARKLERKIRTENKNTFFSPYSIQIALGMTTIGAVGDTKLGLAKAINSPTGQFAELCFFGDLLREVHSTPDYKLATANAVWSNTGFRLRAPYVESVRSKFLATVSEVDFSKSQAAADTINRWCNEHTQGKIPTIVEASLFDSLTRLVLTNAIYFKGTWVTQFDKGQTYPANFTTEGGAVVKTPTMHAEKQKTKYVENDDFQAVSLPYKGDLSMLIVLPKPGKTYDLCEDFVNAIDHQGLTEHKVNIAMPKFKATSEYKLAIPLLSLGATLAFSEEADFSEISDAEELYISEVMHKAFVEVDEEGTEAAAATAVVMKCRGVSAPDGTKNFIANHPFSFYIYNNTTNTPYFVGRLNNPE